ncbi:SGNH/GDSL hydrolase family protein [Bradyrhizobium liaoningense]|uniref:SGNH/GDSL hydrolase family protein n=1 Tax=Bradyrhizobium liaoningense TaxID=43992 RepID=UPI001BA6FE3B|nr:SGNH/GDSL hydrolase family protein [Bradyrhizobium liaoningense]MBR0843868.1 SGNH/GDSL hydrolase family protein [Bradyrhizobium liaoningense]
MSSPDGQRLCKRLALAGLATMVFSSAVMAQGGSPRGAAGRNCPPPVDHASIRSCVIKLNMLQLEDDRAYLVFGDSIVEAAMLRPVCGMTPVNAGFSGAAAQHLAYNMGFLPHRKFEAVVIALGVNNAVRRPSPDIEGFRKSYEAIVNEFGANESTVLVADIMPVEKGKEVGDTYFDNDLILQLNAEIEALANRYGITRIHLHDAFAQADDNSMRPGLTVDGVHLNADGYRIWRRTIAEAVSRKLKCDPTVSAR